MNDKKLRGWAALKANDPERFQKLVSKGGKNSPTNFKNLSPEEHRAISKKGGTRGK